MNSNWYKKAKQFPSDNDLKMLRNRLEHLFTEKPEFINTIMTQLMNLWPQLKMRYGDDVKTLANDIVEIVSGSKKIGDVSTRLLGLIS